MAGFGGFFKPDTVTWELIEGRLGRLKQRRLFGNLVKAGLGLGFGGFKFRRCHSGIYSKSELEVQTKFGHLSTYNNDPRLLPTTYLPAM